MQPIRLSQSPQRQKGAVLVVSLIFLMVLTLIALGGSESARFQERMAGNLRDRSLAFQSAESAIREAEAVIEASSRNAVDSWSGINGLYGISDTEVDYLDSGSWSDAVEATDIDGVALAPRYFIKHLSDSNSGQGALNIGQGYGAQKGSGITAMFRITARGTGASGTAPVIIQTHYGKQY